jgi:hypothetical protein
MNQTKQQRYEAKKRKEGWTRAAYWIPEALKPVLDKLVKQLTGEMR